MSSSSSPREKPGPGSSCFSRLIWPLLCEFPKTGRETWIRVTFLGDGAGCRVQFPLQCWAQSSHGSGSTPGCGSDFLSPGGQAGGRAGVEHPEPHRMSSLVPQHPSWSPTEVVGTQSPGSEAEGRRHMTGCGAGCHFSQTPGKLKTANLRNSHTGPHSLPLKLL